MTEPINHNRLDQVISWSFELKCGNTVAEEFEAFRNLDKLSRSQYRRVQHLERHLEAGEVVCDCYEKVRTDRLNT